MKPPSRRFEPAGRGGHRARAGCGTTRGRACPSPVLRTGVPHAQARPGCRGHAATRKEGSASSCSPGSESAWPAIARSGVRRLPRWQVRSRPCGSRPGRERRAPRPGNRVRRGVSARPPLLDSIRRPARITELRPAAGVWARRPGMPQPGSAGRPDHRCLHHPAGTRKCESSSVAGSRQPGLSCRTPLRRRRIRRGDRPGPRASPGGDLEAASPGAGAAAGPSRGAVGSSAGRVRRGRRRGHRSPGRLTPETPLSPTDPLPAGRRIGSQMGLCQLD